MPVVIKQPSQSSIRLYHGDCLEIMKDIPDNSVNLVLCDLPYGTTSCKWDTIIPFNKLWISYHRVLKKGGVVALHAAQPFTTALISSNIKNFRYNYVWVKNTQTGIALAAKQPMRKHEDICIFYENAGTFNPQMVQTKSAIMLSHYAKGYGRGVKPTFSEHTNDLPLVRTPFKATINPSTVLEFNVVPNRSKERFHTTQKPVALCEYFIQTYTNEGDLVLDNCMGSGTTGIAALNTKRQFIGIEKDERYFQIGRDRIIQQSLTLDYTPEVICK